jgi:hypothetical protein
MKLALLSLVLAAPLAAQAADTCTGAGYTVDINAKTAVLSGNGIEVKLKRLPGLEDPESRDSWPEYELVLAGQTYHVDYFNEVEANSRISSTNYTARLETVNDLGLRKVYDLVCEKP